MRRPPFLPPLLGLLTAACGGARDEAAAEAARLRAALDAMQASLAVLGAPPAPAQAPFQPPAPSRAPGPSAASPAPSPPADPAPAPPPAGELPALRSAGELPAPRSAAELLGHSEDQLRDRLGEPLLRRREGSLAEVWLYAAAGCALDIVLYRERAGGLRVGFAAARAAGEDTRPGTEADCLARIADGPAARPAT